MPEHPAAPGAAASDDDAARDDPDPDSGRSGVLDAGAVPAEVDDVDAVTHAVLTASRLLVAVTARSLAAVEDRVTLPQFRLLVVLATHGDAKLVELADRLGVNPSTAMRMVDRLIAAGLAERRVNPGNRRETVLRVTPEGDRLVSDVTAARRREITAIVERLAPRQRTALVEALTAFTQAGGEAAAHPPGWT